MKNPFESEEHSSFRNEIKKFVAQEMTPFVDDWEETGDVPWELHEKVGSLGVFGFGIDE